MKASQEELHREGCEADGDADSGMEEVVLACEVVQTYVQVVFEWLQVAVRSLIQSL